MNPSASIRSSRRTARIILGAIAASLTLFVLFASGPGIGGISQAQTTPTPTSGYSIQFLNPSGSSSSGPGREASAKQEQPVSGTATPAGYHLVAWVNEVPPGAFVEFKYQSGSNPEVTITGPSGATQNGDTFEFFWDLANVPESSLGPTGPSTITLRAILYRDATGGGSGSEVARDTEALVVNNQSPSAPSLQNENQAETVEITYPTNNGGFGSYNGVGVIDATWSEGTTFVTVSYSVSPVGTEPQWEECGSESVEDAADGIRCEMAEGDSGAEVTAVAAVANDTPSDSFFADPTFNDSGDAHRVLGYEQDPSTVTLASAGSLTVTANAAGDFPCSPTITGVVGDQFGRQVAGVNADVHAARPTDNLFFDDDESAETDRHKAPDKNHPAFEKTVDCESSTVPPPFTSGSSQQGEHEVPGAAGDIKHIETTQGTSDSGTFSFELNNRSQTSGVTDITMWADEDDDDRLCTVEAQGNISIGWGTTPSGSAPASSPEVSSCPRPTPSSPSPTPTESESPSPGPEDPRGCTVTGTDEPETLRGTDGDDIICGNGGDDVIYGQGGNDVLYGDAGIDTVVGGPGDDEMHGGDDDDLIRGGSGADDGTGGAGNDSLNGKSGNDDFRGGGGRDVLTGGDDFDRLFGEGGKDVLKGGEHNDRLVGGSRGDVLRGLNGNDVLLGNGGPDSLDGGDGRDRCKGGPGRDRRRNCER